MIVVIKVMSIECKIISKGLDSILYHERWFVGDCLHVYKNWLFGLEGFSFLFTWFSLLYTTAAGDYKTAPTVILAWFLITNSEHLGPFFGFTLLFPLSWMSNPTDYTWMSPIQHTWYWMCLYHVTVCKYRCKPCCGSCCAYLVLNQSWIYICDSCLDSMSQLTRLDIRQSPHWSQYSDATV